MKNLILFCFCAVFSLLCLAQENYDCTDYQILSIKDTVHFSEPSVALVLTTNNNPIGTGYTDLFFVDEGEDTINITGFWGSWLPSVSNIPSDTISYILPYSGNRVSFPSDFNGHLVTRNPECTIPFSVDLETGIEALPAITAVRIYPNPAKEMLYIDSEVCFNRLMLISITGKELLQTNQTDAIDVSRLRSGVYFIHGTTAEGASFIQKVLIE